MSTTSPPGTQQSLTDALQAAAGPGEPDDAEQDREPLPPAAPAERLVSDDVTAAIDAGLLNRRLFPPARPRRRLIPPTVGQAIEEGLLTGDWRDIERCIWTRCSREGVHDASQGLLCDEHHQLSDHPYQDISVSQSTLASERVVDETLTCDCGRPADADGQCTACDREQAGDVIGNHGRRL